MTEARVGIGIAVALIAFGVLAAVLNWDGANTWRPLDNHSQCYLHQTHHRSWSDPDYYTRTIYCRRATR